MEFQLLFGGMKPVKQDLDSRAIHGHGIDYGDLRSVAPVIRLVFHPCPIWMRDDVQIIVPDHSNPKYLLGHLRLLIEHEGPEIWDKIIEYNNEVIIRIHHSEGLGTDEDLEVLLADLQEEGFIPSVLNFQIREDGTIDHGDS